MNSDLQAAIAKRQEMSPYNQDDADYMLAHPADFTRAELDAAAVTEAQRFGEGQ